VKSQPEPDGWLSVVDDVLQHGDDGAVIVARGDREDDARLTAVVRAFLAH
jgi:hypothetical protein